MNLINLNVFSVFSLLTALLSIAYLVYGLVVLPLKKASAPFAILTAVVFFTSLGSFLSLTMINFHIISAGLKIEIIGNILFPISLLHFTINLFETGIIKIREKYKYLFYLLPITLITFIFSISDVRVKSSPFGFIVNMERYLVIILIPYIMIFIMLAIIIVIFQIHDNNKFNRINIDAIILLIGLSFYFLSSLIYQVLLNVFKIVSNFPSDSIFLFFLYILISISLLSSKIIFENTSLKEAIKHSEDCIMIADSYGNIIEINEHAYKTFYGKNLPLVKLKLVSSKIKSLLLENIADKIKAQALIDFFSKTVIETYKNDISCIFGRKKRYFNVIISPIIGRKNKIIGKLAIFRDTTELNHLQSRLRKEAIRDFLTGAYNRRFFNESLLIEVNRYKRYGFPFCLLMIDIDKFKKVNDDEGHLKGDYILTEAVKIFKKNIRTHLDIVARYGGDEFAVILTNTSLTEAGSIAGRILLQYRDMNLNNTTLSIGVCIYEDNMEMKEMIRNADKAMYSAKANGGDNFSFSK